MTSISETLLWHKEGLQRLKTIRYNSFFSLRSWLRPTGGISFPTDHRRDPRSGSGKTVLSEAFASYVSYILGKRAMVLDFDDKEDAIYADE